MKENEYVDKGPYRFNTYRSPFLRVVTNGWFVALAFGLMLLTCLLLDKL